MCRRPGHQCEEAFADHYEYTSRWENTAIFAIPFRAWQSFAAQSTENVRIVSEVDFHSSEGDGTICKVDCQSCSFGRGRRGNESCGAWSQGIGGNGDIKKGSWEGGGARWRDLSRRGSWRTRSQLFRSAANHSSSFNFPSSPNPPSSTSLFIAHSSPTPFWTPFLRTHCPYRPRPCRRRDV